MQSAKRQPTEALAPHRIFVGGVLRSRGAVQIREKLASELVEAMLAD